MKLLSLDALLLAHPRAVGESYRQHLATAWRFGLQMLAGGLAAIVHGLLPCLFAKTASDIVRVLHERIAARSPAGRRSGKEEAGSGRREAGRSERQRRDSG